MNGNLAQHQMDDRAWRLFLLVGAGLVLVRAATPAGLAADVLYVAVNLGAAVAVAVGIRRNRPSSLLAWRLVFAAVAVQFGLNLSRAIGTAWPSSALPDGVAEVAFLVPYALLAVGLWSFARARGVTADRGALLDSFIVVLGLGLGTFLVVLSVAGFGLEQLDANVVGSFAVSLPSLALAGWLALTPGPGRVPVGLLAAGVAAQSVGDGLLGVGFLLVAPAPEPAWMLSLICYGAAALHPANARSTERPLLGPNLRPGLLVAAILLPTLTNVAYRAVRETDPGFAFDVLTIIVVVLAGVRIGSLFRALEAERHLEAAARQLSEDVIVTSPGIVIRGRLDDASVRYASPSFETVLGYRPEEVVGRPGWWLTVLHPLDRRRVLRELVKGMRRRRIWTGELQIRHADGTYRSILTTCRAEADAGRRVDDFIASGLDVTAWRAAQAELSSASVYLEEIVRSTPVLLIRGRGPELVLDYVSPSVETVLGYRPDEAIGVPGWLVSVIEPSEREATSAAFLASVAGEPRSAREVHLATASGEIRTIHMTIRREFHDDGSWQFSGTLIDITERIETERQLREAKAEAERANRAKSEFLSGMSHELRTPLNAVLGFGQLLERAELPNPDDRDAVAHVLRGGRRLLEMIDGLLELARMDAGRITLSIEPVSVDDVVHEAADLARPAATAKGITLRLPADDPGAWVLADAQRLKQVLLNLVSNAVRYSPSGAEILVHREPGMAAGSWRISVTDHGPGIEPDVREKLFTPFRRGASGGDRAPGGLGVGLALAAGLIEAMAGTIGVDSTPGTGSTFHVELPGTEAPAEAAEPGALRSAGEPQERTIVYIEDNLPNLGLVERILTSRPGTRLLAAMQGRMGMDLARQHEADLILLDLHLPDMSGEEVLAALREDPATRRIPVLVLSSSTEPGLRRHLRSAGADAFLAKPIDMTEFLGVVDQLLARSASRDA